MTPAQAPPLARGHHEGIQAPVAVVGSELLRQLRVEREARAGQRAERRAVTPVEREKSAGLAGGAQATPERSTTVTATPRSARKYATDAPTTPAPHTTTCRGAVTARCSVLPA